MSTPFTLPDSLVETYEQDGFVVLKNVFAPAEVDALRTETLQICMGARGALVGVDEVSHGVATPEEAKRRVLAIHFPHKVSPVMKAAMHKAEIVRALNALIGPDVKAMQSMLFVKGPGKPGQAWHQDESFIPTEDRSLAGVWIALDDARVDNGALWMHPGSHRHGRLWPMAAHEDPRFDASPETVDFPYEREGGVPVEADAGDVVIFHGFILHRSLNNTRTEGYRSALVNHVMSARSRLPWRVQGVTGDRVEDYRDIEMLSGEDPFADAGLADLSIPYVRPEDPAQAARVAEKIAGAAREKTPA